MRPTAHAFRYRLFMVYLDLDELPGVFDAHPLWSARRPAPAWFRRSDYLAPHERPLAEVVRDETERLTGARPMGPVRMLTHLRYFGYILNPVTFYYCYAPGGGTLEAVVAEITNTPWGERHRYALARTPAGVGVARREHRLQKEFHISPFMSMDHEYRWWFREPGPRLTVHMENSTDGQKIFDATLVMRRREITRSSLTGVLLRHPWMTARVVSGIYLQAARLWLKGTPFHPHPGERAA